MPNSDACLIELVVSRPALASPMIFAFELCACNRNDEKSEEFKGMRQGGGLGPHSLELLRFRFRALRLQQERREIGGVQGNADRAHHPAPLFPDEIASAFL